MCFLLVWVLENKSANWNPCLCCLVPLVSCTLVCGEHSSLITEISLLGFYAEPLELACLHAVEDESAAAATEVQHRLQLGEKKKKSEGGF